MVEEQDEKRITLRIPTYIYEAIVDAAKARHISLNSYIVQVLGDPQYAADLEARVTSIEREIHLLQKQRFAMEQQLAPPPTSSSATND